MSCINAVSLHKSYANINAVSDVHLSVQYGEIFGFIGPNGAGKSTLIKLLTTLIKPTSGELSIFGIDAIKHPLRIRNKIGVIFQKPSYEPFLTVEKSLDKYGMLWNVNKIEREIRKKKIIKEFNLEKIQHRRNNDLSIGQRRIVQIAREFMHNMKLLFLDEPAVGLDPYFKRNLLDFMSTKAKSGLTIFFTTHVLTEAEYICDKIAIMNNGKIITTSSPQDLKNHFSDTKRVKIYISKTKQTVLDEISKIGDCEINYEDLVILIGSNNTETTLLKTLEILNYNSVHIEDLYYIKNNLEDVFLKIVSE